MTDPTEKAAATDPALLAELLRFMGSQIAGDIIFAREKYGGQLADDSFIIPRFWMPYRVARNWVQTLSDAADALAKKETT